MKKSVQQQPGNADSVSGAKPMNPHQWRRIKSILDQVSTASARHRADLIRDTCGDDSDLYQEVMSFLRLDSRAETFMDEPLWRLPADVAELTPEMPERLGPYRLLKPLGQGGMGKVYLAVREDDYRQEVAIKSCIGPAKHDLQARFLGERQILARLEHSGIARLLDGGTDPMGFPYLVMEYVEGRPIDEYCQEEGLSLRDRLALVAEICRIVHYAHRNLVVHRDLKPSNILVDTEGRPHLLDFGIAKILDAPVGDGITIQGHLVMTPSCASPEQISGDLITTASDIYSLGVLLHCLLTDTPPYDLTHLPLPQAALLVCSQGVGKPSAAAEEQGKPRLAKRLRGDLDAIVTTAGRKEPEHRYSSAAEMAEDIDSYLEGLPVQARQGNWYYQISRHVRRNKPLVASLSLVAALILISLLLGWKSELARRDAINAQRSAESIKDVLFQLLTAPAPDNAKGRDRTVHEVLLEAAPVIEEQLADLPDIQAEAYSTMANIFSELGDDQTALELQTRALERRTEHSSQPSKSLADDIADLGIAKYNLGHFEEAEALYRQALEMRQGLRAPPLQLAQTLLNLTNTRQRQGQVEGIEEDLLRVLELRRRHEASKLEIAEILYSLGAWELKIGQTAQAIDYLAESLEIRRQELGDDNTKVAAIAKSLARAYHATGRFQEAKVLYSEALETRIQLLGEDHPKVPKLKVAFARLLLDSGEVSASLQLATQATQRSLILHGAGDPLTIEAQSVQAACALALDPSRAERQQLLTQVRRGYESLKADRGEQAFVTRWTYRILSAQKIVAQHLMEDLTMGSETFSSLQFLDTTTRSSILEEETVSGGLQIPGLTIIAHPDPRRIGERAPLAQLNSGQEVSVSRLRPLFSQPGNSKRRPIADPHVSRRPLRLIPHGEGIEIRNDRSLKAGLDLEPLASGRLLSHDEIRQGVTFTLAGRVACLLHLMDPLWLEQPGHGLVGQSSGLVRVRRQISTAAGMDASVLIRGETGTGKELVAQAIHHSSRRQGNPFVAVNMGALSPSLAPAELFGAQRGAFTGSDRRRQGFFSAADGGTLFLDEIGEAPAEIQAMLLRVLETGRVRPVGSDGAAKVDTRILAATDADLDSAIHKGNFRSPLLHRLAGFEIDLPPLRRRRDDISRLLLHFMEQEMRTGRPPGPRSQGSEIQDSGSLDKLAFPRMAADLLVRLTLYSWPGNVRQLRNTARRLVYLHDERISLRWSSELAAKLKLPASDPGSETALNPRPINRHSSINNRPSEARSPAKFSPPRFKPRPGQIDDDMLLEALKAHDFCPQPTARALGISRTSLYALINRSDRIRKAADLSREEIEVQNRLRAGDLSAMAKALEVSRRGLCRRMTELGI